MKKNKTIFCAWTGKNPMSANRRDALYSIFVNTGCPVVFVDHRSLKNWIKENNSFHPAYEFLSETHKADYLRVYLMHYYGGGYTDIKHTNKNWNSIFDEFYDSDKLCAGYTEIGPNGVAPVGGDLEAILRDNYTYLIGLCAFMFKARTPITREWIDRTHDLLDKKFNELSENPSSHAQDMFGAQLPNGNISKYPLKWTELLGDIFHPLVFNRRHDVLHLDVAPSFSSYR